MWPSNSTIPSAVEARSPLGAAEPVLLADGRRPSRGPAARLLLGWNAACLDAPCVVVLWSAALTAMAGGTPRPLPLLLLFSGVWMGYALDRVADGLRLPGRLACTERHRFAIRHRRGLLVAVALLLPVTLTLGWLTLPRAILAPGIAIATAALLHTTSVQVWPVTARRLLPRELVVGGLLALAAAAFAGTLGAAGARATLLVAGLFTLDCWVVASGEVAADRARGEASLAQRRGFGAAAIGVASALLVALALAGSGGDPAAAIALASGAAGLGLLGRVDTRSELRPALADLILCGAAWIALAG